jgi:hypothetical protein
VSATSTEAAVGEPRPRVRHCGRGAGILFAAVLIVLTFVPQQIATDPQGGTQIRWRWHAPLEAQQTLDALKAESSVSPKRIEAAGEDVVVAWAVALGPAAVAVVVLLGSVCPAALRGLLLWLGGLGLVLLNVAALTVLRAAAAGIPVPPVDLLCLAAGPLVFMAAGGHGAALRRGGGFASRCASGFASLLAVAAVAGIVVFGMQAHQLHDKALQMAAAAGVPSVATAANLQTVLEIMGWAAAGLLGAAVVLGLINLVAGSRGLGGLGYLLGLLGVLVVMGTIVIDPLLANLQALGDASSAAGQAVGPDALRGFGKVAHDVVPAGVGIALVFAGWGAMFLRDRPRDRLVVDV